ncbi:MAG: helix-turn-helix domain-containing protein [bacterium]|nr:helix-turn-helix domain-containing protein [bacterium]
MEDHRFLTKTDILKFFCRYPIRIIPIVNKEKKIIGLLRKSDVVAGTPVVSSLNTSIKEVISSHIIPVAQDQEVSEFQNLLTNFRKATVFPVIDEKGHLVDFWDKTDLICTFLEKNPYLKAKEEMFTHFSNPVIFVDRERKITYINPKAKAEFRLKDVIGKQIDKVICPITIVDKTPIENCHIKIDNQEFTYDASPILRGKYLVGAMYIFRKTYIEEDIKNLPKSLARKEKELIVKAMDEGKGDVQTVASLLKISPRSLRYRIKKLNIDRVTTH